jgi:hypothetical protein
LRRSRQASPSAVASRQPRHPPLCSGRWHMNRIHGNEHALSTMSGDMLRCSCTVRSSTDRRARRVRSRSCSLAGYSLPMTGFEPAISSRGDRTHLALQRRLNRFVCGRVCGLRNLISRSHTRRVPHDGTTTAIRPADLNRAPHAHQAARVAVRATGTGTLVRYRDEPTWQPASGGARVGSAHARRPRPVRRNLSVVRSDYRQSTTVLATGLNSRKGMCDIGG